jgi:hypothetical protein
MRILAIALCVMLSSCIAVVQPASKPVARPTVSTQPIVVQPASIWNTRIGLPAYPGASVTELENNRDGSSQVSFNSDAGFDAVYAFFHREISARGWQRTNYDLKDKATKVEANYAQRGNDFKLKLDAQGKSGKYKLEIKF